MSLHTDTERGQKETKKKTQTKKGYARESAFTVGACTHREIHTLQMKGHSVYSWSRYTDIHTLTDMHAGKDFIWTQRIPLNRQWNQGIR